MWQILGIVSLVSVLIGGFSGYRFEHNRYQEYKTSVEVAGKVAQAQAKLIKDQQDNYKKKADAENQRLTANITIANKRLLDSLATRSFLPTQTGSSGQLETVCFDRTKLDQAIRNLATGVSGLTGKGDKAIVDLDSNKRWAQDLKN